MTLLCLLQHEFRHQNTRSSEHLHKPVQGSDMHRKRQEAIDEEYMYNHLDSLCMGGEVFLVRRWQYIRGRTLSST